MPFTNIIITLIVADVLLWAINTYIPMAAPIKKMINIVVVVVISVWLLQIFGIIGDVENLRVK